MIFRLDRRPARTGAARQSITPRLRRLLAVAIALPLAATGLLAVTSVPASATTRNFGQVFSANTTGDVMIRGNTLETCPAGSYSAGSSTLTCANVQAGTSSGENNNFNMGYVDVDSDPTTFDSSSATITIPTGATVLFAALTWSATAGAGSLAGYPALTGVAAPNATLEKNVDFETPASSSYASVTSSQNDASGNDYQGYAVETAAVAAAGSGVYTVANVQAGTGGNDFAGWALAIAYRDPTQPMRNLDVYTGYSLVSNGASTSIPISGFETPLSGAVVTRLGAVVYEGDRGDTGDTLSLGTNAISNALNPVNDVENSSITDLGVAITARNPSYNNTLSIDVDRFDATGFLANGQTSTTINFKTLGDSYFPGMFTLATNLYAPSLQVTKTVKDVTNGISGTVKAGDVLAYSMALTNIGGDSSTSSILTDAVPTGATYVAGSMTINGTSVSDASGDDTGNFTSGTVTARLGTGATASAGGNLAVNATVTVAFQVTVNASDANGTVISNAATTGYNSAATGTAFIGTSNTVTSTVNVINVNPVLAYPAPPSGEVGAAYTDTLTAAGGTTPYTWTSTGTLPTGVTLNSTTGVLSGTPTVAGFYNFTVTATDANTQVATENTSLYVAPAPVLAYPATLQPADVSDPYSYSLGVNPGTGPYVWSVSSGTLPTGLSLNSSTGVVSGNPTVQGTKTFTVKVVDANGGTATESTTLNVAGGPSLSYPAPPAGEINTAYSDALTETGGTTPYLWTISTGSLPAGVSINSANGLLSGTPTSAGTSNFTVLVTDANGATATEVTMLTIIAGPSLTYGATPTGEVNTAYTDTLTASGGTTPYTWSTTGTLPAGLTLSAAGVLSGTPTTAGTSTFMVTATDANSQSSAPKSTSVTIIGGPSLTYGAPPQGETGVAYTDTLTASGGTTPYTWSTTGTLPAGLTLSAAGVLSGTPTTAGTSTFMVTATDANSQSSAPKSTSVTIVSGPTLNFAAPPVETIHTFFSDPLTVSGGTGPYMWLVSSGTLPAGVTLGFNTGILSGTPSVAGTFSFTIEVIDNNGQSNTKTATLVVDPSTALGASATSTTFGTSVTLTATMSPSAASGSVTFTDLLASGPNAGQSVTLGTATISGGSAAATFTLPAFGPNTVTANYGGDSTYAADTSGPVTVGVNAYNGEVIVDQFRLSGPLGVSDQYVQLYNTGPAVSLAGFTLLTATGASLTVPGTAPVLPTGHSYLITGAEYSLGSVAASDTPASILDFTGLQVTAPDGPATIVDAVGFAGTITGFYSGTALPALTATTDQYAWVRLETAGAPVNTDNNHTDFKLVSTDGGVVGGVQSTLGSPSPLASGSPSQSNGLLRSTLLDPTKAFNAAPNFVYAKGAPGLLTVRRTITNSSANTATTVELRITSLSEANGAPEPGVANQPTLPAQLRFIDPATATSTVTVTGQGSVTVENLSIDAPAINTSGGGLDTTLTVSLPSGLAAGASVNIAISFAVDRHGPYWFGYDVDASFGTGGAPDAGRALQALAPAARSRTGRLPARASNNRAYGTLR